MVYCFYSDLALSVCRSTDLESKPEGRQARKQRKMEAIQARLIVPLPPAVTALEQPVSGMCMTQTLLLHIAERVAAEGGGGKPNGCEEIANENRGSQEVLVSNHGELGRSLFDMNGSSGGLKPPKPSLVLTCHSGLAESVGRVCEE
ncbi:unnamed protein product, partial [Musa acuminata subsp. burmannicoides]